MLQKTSFYPAPRSTAGRPNSVNTLADYTAQPLLLPDCRGATATDVIIELSDALDRAGRVASRSTFLEAVLAREKLSPTSLPIGWATPHARLETLPQLSFALARASHPFRWTGGSEVPMRLVWLFAVPETETKTYLNLIAGVVRLGQDLSRIQQLLSASDALEMYQVLQQVFLRKSPNPALAANASPAPKPA